MDTIFTFYIFNKCAMHTKYTKTYKQSNNIRNKSNFTTQLTKYFGFCAM